MPDFGEILFREILKVSQYPGSPFTGDIITDIVLYFFIPTVLLILVIFVLLGRLAVKQKGIRLLLGVAIYLFVVFSGYFAVFVMLGNIYFLFLVFILGLIYFIPTHFRVKTHGYPEASKEELTLSDLHEELLFAKEQLREARKHGSREEADRWAKKVEEMRERIRRLERDYTNPKRYR